MTTLKQKKQQVPTIHKPEVLMERFPYRYVIVGKIELNGKPDCRIQEYNTFTKRWRDTYLCDNEMQLMAAMEDKDYTLWLHNEMCYRSDSSRQYYKG
jgi:hypothetical protein